ncbi:MAG: VWA domain-containing protein [Acidobacteria bacterium]|nr:VWA domain-containing protein [Acidobacteriota bacterium]
MLIYFLPFVALATVAGLATAQQESKIKVAVQLVNLFATVRGDHRQLVPDMKQEEFKIFEDNTEQKIAFFSRETNLPLTIGVLIDTSGSMEHLLGPEQMAASSFLNRVMRKEDLAFVMSFDSNVDLLAELTADQSRLERGIQSARINVPHGGGPVAQHGGGTNLYDAIYLACREKLAGEAGRKALVIITDAEDTGSRMRLEEAIENAQRTDTVIHVLLLEDRRFYGSRPDIARKMAEETGGRSIGVQTDRDLEKAFDQISEELRTSYTLGYYPSNPNRDGSFRKVKVDTVRNGTKALTRKGYYASRN